MLLNPTFDVECPNPACEGTLHVTRDNLRAGSMTCEACKATTHFTGDGARKITESLDRLERALAGLGFKK
jgi:hypothetical protein